MSKLVPPPRFRALALTILGVTIAAAALPTKVEAQRRSIRPTEVPSDRDEDASPRVAPTGDGVRITQGKIRVLDLFRLIEDLSGKTVIPVLSKKDGRPVRQSANLPGDGPFDEHSMVEVVADLKDVTVPLLRALLAANWIALEERVLENGRAVFFAFLDSSAWSQVGSSPKDAHERSALPKNAATEKVNAARAADNPRSNPRPPQLALVDASWTIDPDQKGTILVPITHADLGEMRGAVRTLVGRKSLEILVLADARHLLLDGRGETLLSAVELIRFLDRAELWPEKQPRPAAPVRTTPQRPLDSPAGGEEGR